MKRRWIPGNRVELLENGEEYYPRVFTAIEAARREVLIETFILFDDKVGRELQRLLIDAARRGVVVELTVDGWGSAELSREFCCALADAGVKLHVYDPVSHLGRWRTKVLRRMHRKIVVIDETYAFIGGINFSADHLEDFGAGAKEDFAVRVEGPAVAEVRDFAASPHYMRSARLGIGRAAESVGCPSGLTGDAEVMLVWRDNGRHSTDIERHYRAAIRLARERIVIANAYFFPGYRLLREIRRAAARGVRVTLILQGEPDMAVVKVAASLLYDQLVNAGVEVFEYTRRPLHGKVALVDDVWATVGSSNLDPFSLSLNLEANVMIRDKAFNALLHRRLMNLLDRDGMRVTRSVAGEPGWFAAARSALVYHVVRRFPRWSRMIPRRRIRVETTPPRGTQESH